MRKSIIIGNWKLNGNQNMVNELILKIRQELDQIIVSCTVVIAPPMVYLERAAHALVGSNILLAAQNVDINTIGAFTGETSVQMLKDIGVKYIIIGHSERRTLHKENDILIAKKFIAVKEMGLIPILCIGETEAQRKSGSTYIVCAHQLDSILKILGTSDIFTDVVIAYEPVWAIGTGKSATPKQAQDIHKFIRNHIAQYNIKAAQEILIQYGGSVNSINAAELFMQPDIDGALVGNASLKADTFALIVKSCK
ncbi:triose-phosphate isomerase [Candidatus Profftia lariciata]|uniref:triose-phosphate isomerase n=1 Tax=Candidatus Profftia lariciata TaxID=1987921 RepID=UPI001D00F4F0|nr:triose-phosphate isomerase [Candidatus Profftia lariciata]